MMRTRSMFCMVLLFVASFGMLLRAQGPAAPSRPEGVPNGYLPTPFGWFHPSCVLKVAEGETLLAGGSIIQRADGTLKEVPECKYPHYAASGAIVEAGATKIESPTISGWVESSSVTTSTSYGEIVATWVVPPAPTSNVSQVVYFFPGLMDYTLWEEKKPTTILQPVLGWNMDGVITSTWSIASWNCCPSGTTDESPAVAVNPGDVIEGTVEMTCGAGTGTCPTWNITTTDITSGNSTLLSGTPYENQTFNWAFGGVLEAYSITQCSDYPANGQLTFFNIKLYDDNFDLISSPSWSMSYPETGGTPLCGYQGSVGPTYATLDYALISTVGGDGTAGYSGDGGPAIDAELNIPTGVALDVAGNVYIADDANNRIRKVTASTGDISTVAGDGTAGYSGDGGAATSAELYAPQGVAVDGSGNIYIVDTVNCRIRKVTASTGDISTVAGDGKGGYSGDGGPATSAELYYPKSVALDSSGNIYIADMENNRIRKVTVSTGIITTVAGNGTSGYSGDGGPATSAELNWPYGVALDSSANIYIGDGFNARVRKVTASTGIITTVAGNGTYGYSGDGGPGTSAELGYLAGVATDSANNVYIADFDNCRIRELTVASGIITTVAGDGTCGYGGDGGSAISAGLNSATGVTLSPSFNLYIADKSNNRIRQVAP